MQSLYGCLEPVRKAEGSGFIVSLPLRETTLRLSPRCVLEYLGVTPARRHLQLSLVSLANGQDALCWRDSADHNQKTLITS
jgi:hypothetical protein